MASFQFKPLLGVEVNFLSICLQGKTRNVTLIWRKSCMIVRYSLKLSMESYHTPWAHCQAISLVRVICGNYWEGGSLCMAVWWQPAISPWQLSHCIKANLTGAWSKLKARTLQFQANRRMHLLYIFRKWWRRIIRYLHGAIFSSWSKKVLRFHTNNNCSW